MMETMETMEMMKRARRIGNIACMVAVLQFNSTATLLMEFYTHANDANAHERFKPYGAIVSLLNGIAWICFCHVSTDTDRSELLIAMEGTCVMEALHIVCFFIFGGARRLRVFALLAFEIVVIGAITGGVAHYAYDDLILVMGAECVVTGVMGHVGLAYEMYKMLQNPVAPPERRARVFLSVGTLANCGLWSYYAMLRLDSYTWVLYGIGSLFSIVQVCFYVRECWKP